MRMDHMARQKATKRIERHAPDAKFEVFDHGKLRKVVLTADGKRFFLWINKDSPLPEAFEQLSLRYLTGRE